MASFFAAKPPPLCLPHWGKETASAVDRVLSFILDLRRISPLFFIPLEPYPARFARHLPHAEKAVIRKYRFSHPTSAPSGRPPSIGRRVYPRKPLPLEGAAERSEAGLAFFFGRRSGAFVYRLLETIPLALFHAASTLSGSLRSPPSPRGEGFVSGIPLSPSNLRPFGAPPSIGRREYPRKPLPLEGADERSEAGLASFWGGEAAAKSLKAGIRSCE